MLVEAVNVLEAHCLDLVKRSSSLQLASEADKLMELDKSTVGTPELVEYPLLQQIFTTLHYAVAGESLPSSIDQLKACDPKEQLNKAWKEKLLPSSSRSGHWKREERTGVLPFSHHIPSGVESEALGSFKPDFKSKSRKFKLKSENMHSLFAGVTRTLEEQSSLLCFLQGLSQLFSSDLSPEAWSKARRLLKGALVTGKLAVTDSAKVLYNLELLMRADFLAFCPTLDLLEKNSLRAQPFLPNALFGPAVKASCRRMYKKNKLKALGKANKPYIPPSFVSNQTQKKRKRSSPAKKGSFNQGQGQNFKKSKRSNSSSKNSKAGSRFNKKQRTSNN